MIKTTRLIGTLLVLIGITAYAVTAAESVTALLPAIVGLILLLLALRTGGPKSSNTLTYVALVVSGVAVLASLMPLQDLPALIAGDDVERPAAVITSALMALACLVHVAIGVRWIAATRRGQGAA